MKVHKCKEAAVVAPPIETHPLSFADILKEEGVYESKKFPAELVIVIRNWRDESVHFRFFGSEISPATQFLREGPFRKLNKLVCFELRDA